MLSDAFNFVCLVTVLAASHAIVVVVKINTVFDVFLFSCISVRCHAFLCVPQ